MSSNSDVDSDDIYAPLTLFCGCLNGVCILVCICVYIFLPGWWPMWLGVCLLLSPLLVPLIMTFLSGCCVCWYQCLCGSSEDSDEDPDDDSKVFCHLCQTNVDKLANSEHRSSCAERHLEELRLLPIMFPDVACLRCDGTNPMKLWPKSKVRKFTCSRLTEDCEAREKYLSNEEGGQAEDMENPERVQLKLAKVRVKNLGYNCFMCYPCNYIMCLKCCQRVREDQGGIPAGVSSTSSERGGAAAAASGSTDLPQPSAPPKEVVGTGKPKGTSSFPMTSSEQMPPPPSYNEAMNQEDMV